MNIEIVNLTEENLIDAPEWPAHPYSCTYCICWESPEECIDPAKEKKDDMMRNTHPQGICPIQPIMPLGHPVMMLC